MDTVHNETIEIKGLYPDELIVHMQRAKFVGT
jgi:hypothetical protein